LDDALLEETQRKLFQLVDGADPPFLLLDMEKTEYFGSSFIEMLFRIWNRVNRRSGQFALCSLNPNCLDILQTARLDSLWNVHPDRKTAVAGFSD
jgi:anti-anti-sigma factor